MRVDSDFGVYAVSCRFGTSRPPFSTAVGPFVTVLHRPSKGDRIMIYLFWLVDLIASWGSDTDNYLSELMRAESDLGTVQCIGQLLGLLTQRAGDHAGV